MKRLFSTRWHGIPVAIVSVLLALVLVAGGVLAAGYNFFKADIAATVEEAIYPSYGWGDDLVPYGYPAGSVVPLVTAVPVKFQAPDSIGKTVTFTITKGTADASEFVAGDQFVIPIALRNRGDAPLTVKVTCTSTEGLILRYAFETNTVGLGFTAAGPWHDLTTFSTVLAPHGGNFGSAMVGAQVLFVKVKAENTCPPGLKTISFTLTRE